MTQISKKQIAILHVAKSKLCLTDDEYRDVLEANAGVRSAKSMNYGGFLKVMEHFKTCGFEQRAKSKEQRETPGSKLSALRSRPGMATEAQIRKIKAVWLTLAGSYYTQGQEWRALRGFLKKRFRVEHENFLTFEAAWKVTEATKSIGRRAKSEEQNAKSNSKLSALSSTLQSDRSES